MRTRYWSGGPSSGPITKETWEKFLPVWERFLARECAPRTNGWFLRLRGAAEESARRTACLHGHPLNAENTRIDEVGHRRCRVCERNQRVRRKQALLAQALLGAS